MTQHDEPSSAEQGFLAGWLNPSGSPTVTVILVVVVLGIAVVGFATLWQQFGPQVVASFQLTSDRIEVTPPPEWVRADIKQETMVAGCLADLNLTQPDVTMIVGEAFRMHAWVKTVRRTAKDRANGRIVVHVEYRQPVAMVEVAGGLLPVDIEGVLLPWEKFTSEEVRNYPRIAALNAERINPPGSPWGDARIHEASLLASVLEPYWDKLGLYRIIALTGVVHPQREQDVLFRLTTRGNTAVVWGSAPGKERGTEAPAEQKIARLLALVREKGTLDLIGPEEAIDLRGLQQLEVARVPELFRDPLHELK